MYKRSLELWVGLFVAAGIAALVALALKVGNANASRLDDGYRIYAKFSNIGGLTAKAPVTIAGVRVGRVSDIDLDKDAYRAVVEMSIEGDYDNLPLDTSAAILTSGLLGAQYVGLEPGGDVEFLAEGDFIDITQSAVVLEHLIGQFLFSQGDKDK